MKKSESLSRGKRSPKQKDWARAIEELRRDEHIALDLLLELKKMARSTFYYHLKHFSMEDNYKDVKDKISAIFHKHKGRYGYRRVTLELRKELPDINHKTVKKLMDELGLKCEVRRVKYRSYKGDVGKTAPNIVDRDFSADRPYQKLTTDVTQINIGNSKVFLSPILDMFDGEILTYVISESPNLKMVMDMLNKLYEKINIPKGMLIHSDQGWHYQHIAYQKSLKNHDIVQSMSRKGNCLDNSMMENFFGIMKSELLYANKYSSMDQFLKDLEEYMD
ncbi:IS3 family transposase, partial [Carnobacterium jeotgali]|uniref:IS3 family transposase n=1 Tax=Carnobacterium jeotgali TaxID=545534 RepID=UPI00388E4DF2